MTPAIMNSRVTVTLELDGESVARLGARAAAQNRSVSDYVESLLSRELSGAGEPDEVITVLAAPGASPTIEPSAILRGSNETDAEYALRQSIVVALWSLADNS